MESNTLDLASVLTNSRELLTYWGLRVAAAAALLVGGWVFAAAVRRSLRRLFQRTDSTRRSRSLLQAWSIGRR